MPEPFPPAAFLAACDVIDADHPAVVARARELAEGAADTTATARRCFAFVRDHIRHTGDAHEDIVTCSASQVLEAGTGWCFAKSHLLAALLRASGIPAGLCYQRLALDHDAGFTLHGLNAVWLAGHGWYRCDARGDKEGVTTAFTPGQERLAWPVKRPGETLFDAILPQPLPQVVAYLRGTHGWQEALDTLPDTEVLT